MVARRDGENGENGETDVLNPLMTNVPGNRKGGVVLWYFRLGHVLCRCACACLWFRGMNGQALGSGRACSPRLSLPNKYVNNYDNNA